MGRLMYDDLPTVTSGFWLYDGTLRLPVRIVRSAVRFGSGDWEDEPNVCNDLAGEYFYLVFTTSDGKEMGGGAWDSVEGAIRRAADTTNGTAVFDEL